MVDIRSRIASASLWLAGAKLVSNVLTALSIFLLARLLTPLDFGIVTLATSITAVVLSSTELSLTQALINVREPTPQHYQTAWTLNVIRSALIASLICATAPLVAQASSEPSLENVLYVLSASIFITGLQNPGLAMLERQLLFRQTLFLALITSFVSLVVSVGLAVTTQSYWALVAGTVAGQITHVITSYFVMPFMPRFNLRRVPELWRFSIWLSLSETVTTLNYRFDQILVGYFLGREELGYYTVGGRVAQLPGREAVRPVTATLFPAFSLLKDDPIRLRAAYTRVQTLVTFVAMPISALVALLADPFIRFALGEKWTPAIVVVQIVAASTALETLGSLVDPLAMSKDKTQALFVRNCYKLGMRVPLIAAGVYFGGLNGLLVMRGLAGVFSAIIDMRLVRDLVHASVATQLCKNWRSFAAAAAMCASVTALRHPDSGQIETFELLTFLSAAAALGLATYAATAFLLWRCTGSRAGPERDLLEFGAKLFRRIW